MTRQELVAGCALVALAVGVSTPVLAQEAPPPSGDSQPSASTPTNPSDQAAGQLDEIVVTARRRTERLQDVPLAVTAFSQADLTNRRIESRTDLANFTPSLITITGGYPSEFSFFALRGQGPAFGSTPGVVPYFAEVPEPISVDGRPGTLFDLASVQVLAGPQGTLFGKNATGGNVLFEPQRPTNQLEGYVQAEYGNYNDRRVEFALNVPVVSDKVLLRVGGEFGRRDGYTVDVGPNFPGKDYDNLNYDSVRASLTLRPTDRLELYTVGRYFYSDTNGPGTILKQFNPAAGGPLPALLVFPGLATAVADQAALGDRRVSYDLDEFSRTKYWQVVNQATIQINGTLKLKNIFSYSRLRYRYGYDYDATPYPLGGQTSAVGNPTQAPNYLTEELQLQGQAFDNALNYTFGGYYDRQSLNADQGGQFTQFPLSFILGPIPVVLNNLNHSYATFGQGTFDLTKVGAPHGLSLTAGLRHTWDYTSTSTTIFAPPAVSGSASFDYTSYNLTLDYAPTRGVHVYLASRDAYKAGGVNGPIPVGSTFRDFPPEKLQDLELGLKTQFKVGGVPARLNIAAYRGDYSNIQRNTTEVVSGVALNVTRSAAKGVIQGVEINGAIVPFPGLTLNGSYSYIDAKYTKVLSQSAEDILQGSAFPYTPANKFALGASYEWSLGSVGQANVSANYAYQSRFSTAQSNQAQVKYLPGYGTLNLRAGIDSLAGRPVDLAVFAANVTNSTYATGLQDLYSSIGTVTYTYGEPRTYGLQLRYHF